TFNRSDDMTVGATLLGSGTVQQEGSGTTTLAGSNSFSGTFDIAAGTLAAGASALGAASVALTGGELLATADETLSGALTVVANSIVAAAHGKTFNVGAGGWSFNVGTLQFGAAGQDGTVVFNSSAGNLGTADGPIEVAAGTLKAGNANFSLLVGHDPSTTVDSGATLDLAGFDTTIKNLLGAGEVGNSGNLDILTLNAGNFFGHITGAQSLDVFGTVTLAGPNTYSGNTIIESSGSLTLGDGGSIAAASPVIDGGVLTIDHGDAVTLANAISGGGSLDQAGAGTTTINHANNYSGGTTIYHGTLAVGDGGALGSGIIAFTGGELLATANETLANTLSTLFSADTIAAAHGKTLNVGAG
ncbi:MAG TPA: autotransporter-associated beta strand repeat-containing protein, partial [Thermomicrobiales bacterium]|nr:autotransporter-associated beta strand repeat-containing protein [Thermomicrobiales bacterium]